MVTLLELVGTQVVAHARAGWLTQGGAEADLMRCPAKRCVGRRGDAIKPLGHRLVAIASGVRRPAIVRGIHELSSLPGLRVCVTARSEDAA